MSQADYRRTINYLRGIGWDHKTANSIIKRYASNFTIEKSSTWLQETATIIQGNWDAFMKFYGGIKDELKPRRKQLGRSNKAPVGYDDWYQNMQADGRFAYNGVADDF